MRARGMSQIEIAHELQVSKASISSYMQYLRNQAKETIKEYVTEHLPEQYQVYLKALSSATDRMDGMTTTSIELYDKMLELYPNRVNPGMLWEI